jgi:23S rRNA pseudouridine1911/1915/1917 synthase
MAYPASELIGIGQVKGAGRRFSLFTFAFLLFTWQVEFPAQITVTEAAAGQRLDVFLTEQIPDVSRARVQQLIEQDSIRLNRRAARASAKLRAGDRIELLAAPHPPPLRAMAEAIPLDVVYEDESLAVINKPAGMMVHAGAGATEAARNRGTLVNALLHRFGKLSGTGGELRPGIVHRLDRQTSGLIVVAKNDATHRKLARQFASRAVNKTYIALVHGNVARERDTIRSTIARDPVRRTRMSTRGAHGREAVTHYRVLRRIRSRFGKFTLLEVKIETGRTHQIRVHMAAIGHPIVGDALYGAPRELRVQRQAAGRKITASAETAALERNFLHAAAIELVHPVSCAPLSLSRPLPRELQDFLALLER